MVFLYESIFGYESPKKSNVLIFKWITLKKIQNIRKIKVYDLRKHRNIIKSTQIKSQKKRLKPHKQRVASLFLTFKLSNPRYKIDIFYSTLKLKTKYQ